MSETFLEVATPMDLAAAPPPFAVAALADTLVENANSEDPTNVRVGVITGVEAGGNHRVQVDITGTSWVSRTADAALAVGDRVWCVQQGPVTIVAGRLSGIDAFTPIGAMVPYAGAAAPTGWMLCDGSAVPRASFTALFAVIGTTYGAGNGTTTFNLPNLTNRVPVGSGGSYARANTGGAASVTLSTSQMPNHDHGSVGDHTHGGGGSTTSVGDHSHGVGNQGGRDDILAGGGTHTANDGTGSTSGAGGHSHLLTLSLAGAGGHTHSGVGSGSPHENMPPFLAMPYIIRSS